MRLSLAIIAWSVLTGVACREFALKGRIGLAELNYVVTLLGAGVGAVFYSASAKRLRDLNFPGWCVKIFAFPLFGVIFLPVLCFVSGPRWANDFGPAPEPSGFLKATSALICFLIAVLVSFWAVVTYQQTRLILF